MLYLVLGGAALAAFLWSRVLASFPLPLREWRLGAGALAIAAFTAAAFMGLRGEWGRAAILIVLGLWLASTVRVQPGLAPVQLEAAMSRDEARAILGVSDNANAKDIRSAHSRLMLRAHPDLGGTHGLAIQLNAARDVLLGRRQSSPG